MKIDNETEEHRSSFVIICFLFGAKHFQVGTGWAGFHERNQFVNIVWSWCEAYCVRKRRFLTKKLRGLKINLLPWWTTTRTMFVSLIVYLYMQNFKWFGCMINLKNMSNFRTCRNVGRNLRHGYFFCILGKINITGKKIDIERRSTRSFIIFKRSFP